MRATARFVVLLLFGCCQVPTTSRPQECTGQAWLAFCGGSQEAFVDDDGQILAIDLRTRVIKWRRDFGGLDSNLVVSETVVAFAYANSEIRAIGRSGGVDAWVVPRKSKFLALSDSTVIAQTDSSEGAIGIDERSGHIVWEHKQPAANFRFLHFLDWNQQFVLTDAVGLDGLTGKVVMRWPRGFEPVAGGFFGDLRVLASSTGDVLAYRRDGALAWRLALPWPGLEWTCRYVGGSDAGGVLVLAAPFGGTGRARARVMGIALDGSVRWSIDTNGSYEAAAVIGSSVVVVSGEGRVSAYAMATGAAAWHRQSALPLAGLGLTCQATRCLLTGEDRSGRYLVGIDSLSGDIEKIIPLPKRGISERSH